MTLPIPRGCVTDLAAYRRRAAAGSRWDSPALSLPAALPAAPPTGTVTFLLTDIEDSTPRWEQAPDVMAEAVSRHYAILDAAVAAHGGVRPLEQGEGDSLVAAFPGVSAAVAAALAAQSALSAESWPDGARLDVRMALHTGEARLRDGVYYVGPGIIRCARLRALAYGGQVLLSGVTADLLVDALPPDTALLPLGSHRLKGMRDPEQVFQLTHPGLRTQFPPLHSLDVLTLHLPTPLTSFVGRAEEVRDLTDLMARQRMVTVAGPGGAGKTRVALQVAADATAAHQDGVFWVDLSPVAEQAGVPRAVMHAVGLDDPQRIGATDRVVSYLADRNVLLVLDNCEHVTNGAAALVRALLACPHVAVLATSREPLGIDAEAVWRLGPLALPPDGADPGVVLMTEAVQLFAERAAAARPGFVVEESDAAVVGELCARLDGLPLAIELAAARVRALSPRRILDGLARRFALLTGGVHGVLPHHQTLAASMAWSHDLLAEDQQILLRRLAVFTSSFDLAAAEGVATTAPLTPGDVMILLADLVDRSLVAFDGDRYRLLATVAEFAAERLDAAGEAAEVRRAHAAHFAAVAAEAGRALADGPKAAVLDGIRTVRGDILAAIAYHRQAGDAAAALQIVVDLAVYWPVGGHYTETAACLRGLLAELPEPSPGRCVLLCALAWTAIVALDRAHHYGIEDSRRAAADARDAGWTDVVGRSAALTGVWLALGAPLVAAEAVAPAHAAAVAAGDTYGAGLAEAFLSLAYAFALDRADLAGPWQDRLTARTAATGSRFWAAWAELTRGMAAQRTGRPAEALAALSSALEVAWELGDPNLESWAAMFLAETYVDLGDRDAAEAVITRSASWQDRTVYGRAEMSRARLVRAALDHGDLTEARALVVTELDPFAEFPTMRFDAVIGRARLALAEGDLPGARRYAESLVAGATTLPSPFYLTLGENLLGVVARAAGAPADAEDAHHRALALCDRHSFGGVGAGTLERLAGLGALARSWAEAARLYGAADALRTRTGRRRPPVDAAAVEADLAAIAAALGPAAYALAWEKGGRLGLAEAAAFAVRARTRRGRLGAWDSLTPAEREVVRLVAEGLSNDEIGARLRVSRETVKTHLRNVFPKFGISRRAELAALATARRLSDGK